MKSIEHDLSDRSQTNLKLKIIKAGDFIKSTPAGDLDMKASKQGLAQITLSGAHREEATALIDLREVESRLSTTDIFGLAAELADEAIHATCD